MFAVWFFMVVSHPALGRMDPTATPPFETIPPPVAPAAVVDRLSQANTKPSQLLCDSAAQDTAGVPARCEQTACRFSHVFDAVKEYAKSGRSCMKNLRDYLKRNSPWAKLDIFARFKLTLELAKRHAGAYESQSNQPKLVAGGDKWAETKAAMMTCIGVRETGNLEPLSISYANCAGRYATQAGLGGQVRRYYEAAIAGSDYHGPAGISFGHRQNVTFESSIPRYQGEAGKIQLRNYDNLTTDPELQLEFMDYNLSSIAARTGKRLDPTAKSTIEYLARQYNLSRTKDTYGKTVANCTECILHLAKDSYTESQATACMNLARGASQKGRR
jgi:hypothetical protein